MTGFKNIARAAGMFASGGPTEYRVAVGSVAGWKKVAALADVCNAVFVTPLPAQRRFPMLVTIRFEEEK